MDQTSLYADLVKTEKDADGTLLVTGVVSDETVDIDQQIADHDWLKRALPDWFAWGNIREQHSAIAAGVATELAEKDGAHHVTARVVDPGSIRKVETGVLKGFSIGIKAPRIVSDKAAAGGRIVDGQIVEVSLVDRPANPSCRLTLAKTATTVDIPQGADPADVLDAERGLVKVEELAEGETAKRAYTDAQRKDMADAGQAMPGGGFPIRTAADLRNAVRAVGRAKDPAAAKAHIRRRAEALGRTDLIPDSWKAASEEMAHDPATLTAVRDGLARLMQAELDEMLAGEDETFDLSMLLQALQLFLCWWEGEAAEGEAVEPAAAKTAQPEPRTFDEDTVKAMIEKAVSGATGPLLARLETVEKMAAPGGPARIRSQPDLLKAAAGDSLRAEIARLSTLMKTTDDPTLQKGYAELVISKERQLTHLTQNGN